MGLVTSWEADSRLAVREILRSLRRSKFHCCEVLSVVTTTLAVLCDVSPWCMVDNYRRFGRTCLLHLQGRKVIRGLEGSCETLVITTLHADTSQCTLIFVSVYRTFLHWSLFWNRPIQATPLHHDYLRSTSITSSMLASPKYVYSLQSFHVKVR
jgi:hypothetical protein